jgi:nitroimidazol reductase NimA-like FMN-containing flavoprotein (pyridoxamine 5'-phosphate oxidase superfamily)
VGGREAGAMVGMLTDEETESLLMRQSVGRIGCAAANVPYVVPMRYGYDGAFVYGCALPGQKLEIMRSQPRVCFQVDELDGPGGRDGWRSAIVDGWFEEISSEGERKAALRHLRRTERRMVPDTPGQGAMVLFRLRIASKSGRFGHFSDLGVNGGVIASPASATH